MRMLLVEDEITIAVTLSDDLRGLGHEVVVQHDGAAALRCLAEPGQVFDCLITDLRMPGADGLRVAAAARGRRADMLVVVMSAWVSPAQAELMLQRRLQFVGKPFRNEDVMALIAAAG